MLRRTHADVALNWIISWLHRVQPSEGTLLLVLAALVGAASGLGIVVFRLAFEWLTHWLYHDVAAGLARLHPWLVALLVPLGGLAVGWLVHVFIGEERHHGVAGIMEAVALAGGRLRYWSLPAKTLAAVLSIASGASVGPEDPSVQIGANLGSAAGQLLKLSGERVRLLVGAGAAGGIAATFNAPIAGVFFALEIIMGEFTSGAFGVVVLSAVVSSVVSQPFLGAQPAFSVPAYVLNSPLELVLYLGLGVLAAGVAVLYVGALYRSRDTFHNWAAPAWLKPAAAGALVGVLGLVLPHVRSVGYESVEGVLNGHLTDAYVLAALVAFKLLATAISIGSGFVGGVFAPSLFLGAMLGGAYGLAMQRLFPSIVIAPGAYAMVGMAAVLAGAVRSPLTAVLLLFEMTHDYRIILPLMFAVGVSLLVAERWQPDSVYTLSLRRKGIRLERGHDVDVMQGVTVEQAMTSEVDSVPASLSAQALSEWFAQTRHHGAPVVDEAGQLVGVVTLHDLDVARSTGPLEAVRVADICTRDVLTAYPDEPLWAALERLGVRDVGRLPVLSRESPERLVGLLRRQDIIRAYNAAIAGKMALQHRAEQVRLGSLTGTDVLELEIAPGCAAVGKTVAQVPWPPDCILASIRRGRRVFFPHGRTLLMSGDVLVVVTSRNAVHTIEKLLRAVSCQGRLDARAKSC